MNDDRKHHGKGTPRRDPTDGRRRAGAATRGSSGAEEAAPPAEGLAADLLNAAVAATAQLLTFNQPADAALSAFFRARKSGARDRSFIAETAYAVLRRKRLLERLAACGPNLEPSFLAPGATPKRAPKTPSARRISPRELVLLSLSRVRGMSQRQLEGALLPGEAEWLADIRRQPEPELTLAEQLDFPDWLVERLSGQPTGRPEIDLARAPGAVQIPRMSPEELLALARALNQMAVQLGERLRIITEQRNEQEAVFNSMVEGVLAVDKDEMIINFNPAAARLLGLKDANARGHSMQEIVRNPDLQKFITGTLAQSGVLDGEITIYGGEDIFLQLHGTVLTDAAGMNIGALVVLNDVSRLKRLETVRRDFVANVSHELKTPVTALKGCAETLADLSSVTDQERKKFIAMMARHVERLEAIVNDLLSLSKIEFDAGRGRIQLEISPLGDVLRRAAGAFTEQAAHRKMTLNIECPEGLAASLNAELLEQAVGNLVDNALKYGGEGTRVTVGAKLSGNDVEINVSDQGPGIEKRHLDRIFERFYRVDKARSRELGGTGLGLSIVKNIIELHEGSVGVESTEGLGSKFFFLLPKAI